MARISNSFLKTINVAPSVGFPPKAEESQIVHIVFLVREFFCRAESVIFIPYIFHIAVCQKLLFWKHHDFRFLLQWVKKCFKNTELYGLK